MEQGVGDRTARARKLAGLTQWQLAERANVSVSLLRKVEHGNRPASPAFTAAVARALGVSTADLYGQPFDHGAAGEHSVHAVIPELRRELAAYRLPPDACPSRTLTDLSDAVARAPEIRPGRRASR